MSVYDEDLLCVMSPSEERFPFKPIFFLYVQTLFLVYSVTKLFGGFKTSV